MMKMARIMRGVFMRRMVRAPEYHAIVLWSDV